MTGSEKRLKQLEEKLKDEKEGVIVNAITSLRVQKPCPGAIRLFAELFNSTSNHAVKRSIEDFMNDLKDLTLRDEVIAELRKEYRAETIKMIVSSCWQSGLDYSPYASDFALIFSTCDLETAIECFTVIEGCSGLISRKTRDHMIIIVKEHEENRTKEKSALMMELVRVLS
jgi:hypothetical protein